MFDKSIIETDVFMDMSMPTKALYFLLGMEADDEGFVSPKRVMRIYGGNDDDLKVLIVKGFVIQFDSGVVVITDWKENNYLDKNRIKPTQYQNEKKTLELNKNKYMLNRCLTDVQPVEKSIEEKSIVEKKKSQRFTPPLFQEVIDYCNERGNSVDPEAFIDHYESNGWYRGKTKIKDWRACVRTWEKSSNKPRVEKI